jgi:putative transposase
VPFRSGPIDPKVAFIIDVVERQMSVQEAAGLHGIGQTCAYKWLERYRREGLAGLEERSRAPQSRPRTMDADRVERLLALKERHPSFGPAKLVAIGQEELGEHFMAPSTAGKILDRYGKVRRYRGRRKPQAGRIIPVPFTLGGPGHSMTVDYKGQFKMGNERYCYALTLVEPVSRYIFAIEALSSTATSFAKRVFERVFREYGVPAQIISDNGTPFCSGSTLGGITELSRWWIDVGVTPVRIERGKPGQNGRHERMHRTLKDWIAKPEANLRRQQQVFDAFRDEFNNIRPHQSHRQKPPVRLLTRYQATFPTKIRAAEYSELHEVRKVRANGEIKWKGGRVFLSEVLVDAAVGLLPIADGVHEIRYRHVCLGYLDDRTMKATNTPPELESDGVERAGERVEE